MIRARAVILGLLATPGLAETVAPAVVPPAPVTPTRPDTAGIRPETRVPAPVASPAAEPPSPLPARQPLPAKVTGTAVPPVVQANGSIVLPAAESPEDRARQNLLANAERLNLANQELLARNQKLLMQNENLSLQVRVLEEDRSSEGWRNGALSALAGVFLGWLLTGLKRTRKDTW